MLFLGSFLGKLRLGGVKSPILNLALGSLPTDECRLVWGRIIPSNLHKGSPQPTAKPREEARSSDFQNSR